jgi:CRP-like cAMP-binding protein
MTGMPGSGDRPPRDYFSLVSTLSRRDVLTEKDLLLISALPMRIREYGRGAELIPSHSRPNESCLLLEGLCARVAQPAAGISRTTAIQVPGDFVDLHALLLRQIDHSVVALTNCRAGFVPHRDLRRLLADAPHLTRLFWLLTVIDGAIQRTWIANCSGRNAISHIAHFLCEMYARLEAAGLANDHRFDLNLTQQQLAEVIGISSVHANRSIQKLRQLGMISWTDSEVRLLKAEALKDFASFDPVYLSLSVEPR